jgi:hypothetical protein
LAGCDDRHVVRRFSRGTRDVAVRRPVERVVPCRTHKLRFSVWCYIPNAVCTVSSDKRFTHANHGGARRSESEGGREWRVQFVLVKTNGFDPVFVLLGERRERKAQPKRRQATALRKKPDRPAGNKNRTHQEYKTGRKRYKLNTPGRESFSAKDQTHGKRLTRKRLPTPDSPVSTKKYLAGCLSARSRVDQPPSVGKLAGPRGPASRQPLLLRPDSVFETVWIPKQPEKPVPI